MCGPFSFCKKEIRLQNCIHNTVATHEQNFINNYGRTWLDGQNVAKILEHFWDAKTEAV